MAIWDDFKTTLRGTDGSDHAFANIPTAHLAVEMAVSGSATGAVAAREGAPTLATDGVDIEGHPVVNVATKYADAAGSVADVQVFTWLMDADEDWYQVEADASPTVLIDAALASAQCKVGPAFASEGWKRIYHEFVASDATGLVEVKVFPHND